MQEVNGGLSPMQVSDMRQSVDVASADLNESILTTAETARMCSSLSLVSMDRTDTSVRHSSYPICRCRGILTSSGALHVKTVGPVVVTLDGVRIGVGTIGVATELRRYDRSTCRLFPLRDGPAFFPCLREVPPPLRPVNLNPIPSLASLSCLAVS